MRPNTKREAFDERGPIHPSASVQIVTADALLEGDLVLPRPTRGLVVFAHGSGSSRFSTRNRHVAERLQSTGLGTLLMDLLTPDEEALDLRTQCFRFDIPLLAGRVVGILDWLTKQLQAQGGRSTFSGQVPVQPPPSSPPHKGPRSYGPWSLEEADRTSPGARSRGRAPRLCSSSVRSMPKSFD